MNHPPPPVNLFTDAATVLQRSVNVDVDAVNSESSLSKLTLCEQYEIRATVEWIISGRYKRVALQFPDDMLADSAFICAEIQRKSGSRAFVLADTTYGSCCVDEIAAQHASADCLVHYGDSCMSAPSTAMPVRFVYGRQLVDLDDLVSKLKQLTTELSEFSERVPCDVSLLYDCCFIDDSDKIRSAVERALDRQVFDCRVLSADERHSSDNKSLFGRILPQETTPIDTARSSSTKCLVYLSANADRSPLLPLWLLSVANISKVFTYDVKKRSFSLQSVNSVPLLRRRLFLIEQAKDANTIGLVCCALNVQGHLELLHRLKHLCKLSNKKCYVFCVGKPNVAKLSNFASEIDLFVLMSCPYDVLLNTKDYYRPVVTAFEAEMAWNPLKQWDAASGWTPEFSSIAREALPDKCSDGAEVTSSLITGQIRGADGSNEKVLRNSQLATGQMQIYTAANHFGDRSWKGLEETFTPEPVEKAQLGRCGIASGYSTEPPGDKA